MDNAIHKETKADLSAETSLKEIKKYTTYDL
jgi:hypothetical protein